jgi:hypothetical protein
MMIAMLFSIVLRTTATPLLIVRLKTAPLFLLSPQSPALVTAFGELTGGARVSDAWQSQTLEP